MSRANSAAKSEDRAPEDGGRRSRASGRRAQSSPPPSCSPPSPLVGRLRRPRRSRRRWSRVVTGRSRRSPPSRADRPAGAAGAGRATERLAPPAVPVTTAAEPRRDRGRRRATLEAVEPLRRSRTSRCVAPRRTAEPAVTAPDARARRRVRAAAAAGCLGLACLVTWIVRRITLVRTAGWSATVLLGACLPGAERQPGQPAEGDDALRSAAISVFTFCSRLEPPGSKLPGKCARAPAQGQASRG